DASRLAAVKDLLTAQDRGLRERLSQQHELRLYRFSGAAQPTSADQLLPAAPVDQAVQPDGPQTQVVAALRSVLEDLQGQRVAGAVVLSDGRETPASARADA